MRPFFGIRRGLLVLIITMTILSMNHVSAQIEWEKYPNNPVLDIGAPGTWDSGEVLGQFVIYDGSEYRMWYHGRDGSYAIGFATSPDGVNWTKCPGNPVFPSDSVGAWHGSVSAPTVLFNDGVYKMWYHEIGSGIGYATSPDGINWTRYAASPVLGGGSHPSVLFDGTEYKMWYGEHSIDYATSPDGINWTEHPDSPVLRAGGANSTWDVSKVAYPCVIYDGNIYEMWYTGTGNARVINGPGYATSPDGINWTKHPDNPVLDRGETGTFDSGFVFDVAVIRNGTSYEMWYAGNNGSYISIGYAVSSPQDGTSAAISVETMHTVSKDESFPAAINVENISDLAGFQFDIAFDPDVLRAVALEEGTFLSDNDGTYWLEPDIDNDVGMITGIACAMTTTGGADGSGALATITFKALSIGESHIKLQNIVLSDPNGGIIPVTSADASVIVVDYPSWDVNKDGVVNVIDMVLVGQDFGKSITAPQYPNPDVNGDGVVNIQDIVLVGQHFGEVYSATAPSQDLWSVDPPYLPILAKIYAIMEAEPSAGPDLIATKSLIFRLMANAGIIRTEVFQNYPNPFNPDTWIPYQLAQDSEVTIRIYDSAGRLIRTLDLGHRAVGLYITRDAAAYWDGKTDTGEYVSSGIFFYTIQAGEFTATRKMAVEK